MADKIAYESKALHTIHHKANTAKNECFFVGFLDGILANDRIDETELEPLLAECAAICRLTNDEDAAEIIAEANAGHNNTVQELLDLLRLIVDERRKKIDAACHRSRANRILGFCAGVNCDNVITRREAKSLAQALSQEHDLQDDPRIAALRYRLTDALEDDIIDAEESREIGRLITSLVGDSYSDTGIPSSETIPVIEDLDEISPDAFEGMNVVLTGTFNIGSRQEVSDLFGSLGAMVQAAPSRKTDFVVVGSNGSPHYTHKHHGGKLAKALALRSEGPAPRIYVEAQLRHILKH